MALALLLLLLLLLLLKLMRHEVGILFSWGCNQL